MKTSKLLILLSFFALRNLTFAQDIEINLENSKLILKVPNELKKDDKLLKTEFKIKINGCTNTPISKLFIGDAEQQTLNVTGSTKIYTATALALSELELKKKGILLLKVTCDGISEDFEFKNDTESGGGTSQGQIITLGDDTRQAIANKKYEELLINPKKRYNRANDEAYILLDENASVVGGMPVNLDSDDFISVYMKGKKSELDKYVFKVNGEYRTNDLEQTGEKRPTLPGSQKGGNNDNTPPDPIIIKQIDIGWFTDELTISVFYKKDNISPLELRSQIPIKINKLYNITYTVSLIKSSLNQPDYELTNLASPSNSKTITEITGSKPFVTFNAIFYWYRHEKGDNYKRKEDFLTRGRDILKEPMNILSRINPTVGVSIDRNIRENLFLGLTYQFARGGYIVGGRHFGMVKSLVDTTFKPGVSIFNGTNDDIKTKQDIKNDWYFGVSLDLRIFNRLFN